MQCGQSCTQLFCLIICSWCKDFRQPVIFQEETFLNGFLENVLAILHFSLHLFTNQGRVSWGGISSHSKHVWWDENSLWTLHSGTSEFLLNVWGGIITSGALLSTNVNKCKEYCLWYREEWHSGLATLDIWWISDCAYNSWDFPVSKTVTDHVQWRVVTVTLDTLEHIL